MKRLEVRRLGLCPYAPTVALQEELVRQRRAGEIPDTLLLLEHEAVVTVGRALTPGPSPPGRGQNGNGDGIPVVQTSRGGQATYHGPGQLVAYPILDLRQWRTDLHWYLRQLEAVGIETLRAFGLSARNMSGHTGVWVGDRKIASIGIAVRGWITYHGLALNVDCDLFGFAGFSPCGLSPETMTSMRELGLSVTVPQVAMAFAGAFQGLFEYDSICNL